MDKRKIEVKENIKALGSYEVILRLHSKVQAKFILAVKAIEN
ncbi:MAG: 50S ribosomal L9 C-terminal domain-containing protein [Clostridiales bacterium]